MSARRTRRAWATLLALALGAWGWAQDLPPCTVDERVVTIDPEAHPALVLLDHAWRLPPGYAPRDLVPVSTAGFPSDHLVRAIVVDDLRALRAAAEAEGLHLAVQSAFRSEDHQARVHDGWVHLLGAGRAVEVSARAGHSEHQLGTAVDLRSAAGPPAWDLADWAATPEGAWVADHAHRFGFVVSYPRGAEAASCYAYEPWHLRWVGREGAVTATAAAVAYRAWLYLHHPPPATP